ncbi:CDP-glucose 4,6-dehydratase [Paenibacillus sp. IHBB 10380]|uniref:CDP-glucose 4,6-dehydratase n=1 Tax=Paenibacillus sp. IHBB 10380 TaxID=1566358 RepID=UPI0005CFA169|nr:CDP-glucose 4,6-dehydratase [Paenibacillus sp. IHBB 10380]AJS57575.1 CDP-glucose 4,6-dehydratase [Paenibacillus sp. IHBB 10380]
MAEIRGVHKADSSFWNHRKVLITGHTGFKGSWLSLWLSSLGAEVTGYALQPCATLNLFSLCGADKIVQSVIADIRDKHCLEQTIREVEPEIIIHMAAQPLVRRSYRLPSETYEINVLGTVYLLEAVRAVVQDGLGIKAVLNVTTDKCYENREWAWGYRENDSLGGLDPYSNSKACSELVTAAFRSSYFSPAEYESHGVSVATARAGNVIGGGDGSEDRLVPDCIRALLTGSRFAIRNPLATRPWQHVLEPLHGYLLLAQKMVEEGDQYAGAWNFGPEDASVKNVEWMVTKLGSLWGEQSFYDLDVEGHPHEATDLKLDSSKARMGLNWHPKWRVETALEKTVEWFRVYQKQGDIREMSLRQIQEYMLELV